MADKTISELVEATSIGNSDLFILQQDNVAKKLKGENLANYIYSAAGATKEEIEELLELWPAMEAAYGAPRMMATAAGFADADHELIYVFTGTTDSTYTNGHWYYWDGSSWADGGVYNSTAFTTDTSLTGSGAAADAKTVGDKAFLVRGSITAWSGTGTEPDFRDGLTQPGMYYKENNISVAGGVNDQRARILMFRSSAGGYGQTIAWFDVTDGKVYTSVKSSGTSSWTAWQEAADNNRVLAVRSSIASTDDLNDLTLPGIYLRDTASGTASDHHAVNNNKARVVVIRSPSTTSAMVQVWYDMVESTMYFRTLTSSSGSWSAWHKVLTDAQLETDRVIMMRSSLSANDDLDSLTLPGLYFKEASVKVAHGIDTRGARILVLRSPILGYAITQLWMDAQGNRVYSRTKRSNNYAWTRWKELTPAGLIPSENVLRTAADVYDMWDSLVSVNQKLVTKSTVLANVLQGESADGVYPIYMYTINTTPRYLDSGYHLQNADNANSLPYKKPRVLVTGCLHGNEQASAVGLYSAVLAMLTDSSLSDTLSGVIWDIVPLCNPWGLSHSVQKSNNSLDGNESYFGKIMQDGSSLFTNTSSNGYGLRCNADGYDINRDFSDSLYDYSAKKPAAIGQTYVYQGHTYTYENAQDTNRLTITVQHGRDGANAAFKTPEATALASLILSGNYDFILDCHQSNTGDSASNKDVVGMCSCRTSDAENNPLSVPYAAINRANGKMAQMCSAEYDNTSPPIIDRFEIWHGEQSDICVLCKYAVGGNRDPNNESVTVPYAATMEVNLYCTKYTGSSTVNNQDCVRIDANYALQLMIQFARMLGGA